MGRYEMAERAIDPFLNFVEGYMSTIYINSYLQTGTWYAGLTDLVAVYQPKGAASLAASYVNLVNPGTYDAAPGVAPTLGASGWIFNGTSQYLTTGYSANQNAATLIVRFADKTNNNYIAGWNITAGSRFALLSNATGPFYRLGNVDTAVAPAITAGVLTLADKGYRNGTAETAAATLVSASAVIFIGALNQGGPSAYGACTVQALAICSSKQSAAQILAASAAVALI